MSITYKLVYQKNCSIKKSDWDVLQVKLKELWQEPKKRSKTYDILDNIYEIKVDLDVLNNVKADLCAAFLNLIDEKRIINRFFNLS